MSNKKINLQKIYRFGIYQTFTRIAKNNLNNYPLTFVKGYDSG